MTKSFEEVKRPENGPITELNNSVQSVLSQYRKMREYADYLEYELKQKDEHILKVENENSFLRDEHTTFDSNGNSVEPIIKHQPLPEVPEFVAEYIEKFRKSNAFHSIKNLVSGDEYYTYPGLSDEVKNWISENIAHQELLVRAWLDGYTVQKPKQFYIEFPKVSKRDSYPWVDELENGIIIDFTDKKSTALKLTEQEIKSIDERYWQFAVPVEDRE